MDKLKESRQGKIDRLGPKATYAIERCIDELTKVKDLTDIIFTTALERFHSHNTPTIFLRLDENKLWFYRVLSVLYALASKMITRPNWTNTHPKIASDPNFYPYFKGRKGALPMPECWTMQFYKTAHFLSLNSGRQYRTPQDMFNHAHSRLRSVIERCFAILKKRFPILQLGMPSYLLRHQVEIVIACCTLHDFIPMTYAGFLTRAGFPQEEHKSLEIERRFMWMIGDANAAVLMSYDQVLEGQTAYWSRAMRRHDGYPYQALHMTVIQCGLCFQTLYHNNSH
ncbi:hypothetical protein Sango_2326900, partial [Sesamum angolense]